MSIYLQANGVMLPSPASITTSQELIWTADTGRTQSGKMAGGVVAEKMTLSVKWVNLTGSEMAKIKNNLPRGFFKIRFSDNGDDKTLTVYHGPISKDQSGESGDLYKTVSVDLIER